MNTIVNIAIAMKEIDERNAVARSEKNPFNHPMPYEASPLLGAGSRQLFRIIESNVVRLWHTSLDVSRRTQIQPNLTNSSFHPKHMFE